MRKIWKSLDSLKGRGPKGRQDEFAEELPVGEAVKQVSRRDFFRWSGLGFAVGLATGCDHKKAEKALSYLEAKEGLIPGTDLWYATTCPGCSAGCGALAKTRDGRPIKLEGNPEHPLSQGGLCAVGQAQVRALYDSERLRSPFKGGAATTWADLDRDLIARFKGIQAKGGRVRVLSGTLTSPSQLRAVKRLLGGFKDAQHVSYDALSQAAIPAAYERTHGVRLLPQFRLEEATFLLGIEADFLGTWINPAGFGRAYATRRSADGQRHMSKHVQVEAGMSLTGSNADERLRVAPSEAAAFVEHLCCAVEHLAGLGSAAPLRALEAGLKGKVHGLAEGLWHAKGESLVLCGLNDLHAQIFTARLNRALGNEGRTLDLAAPGLQKQGDDLALQALVKEMADGQVDAVLLLDVNPAYDLPPSLGFDKGFAKVPLRLSLGRHEDETAALCTHLAPDHHPLETWRDAEPVKGLFGLCQPLIQPLFGSRDACESLLLWAGAPQTALEFVKGFWREEVFPKQKEHPAFEAFWYALLQQGFVKVDAAATAPGYREDRARTQAEWAAVKAPQGSGFEFLAYAKVGLFDGRFAGNPWLQELPDPITKITWDNYVQLSPKSAQKLKVEQGDLVLLKQSGKPDLRLPVVIQPGLHDRTAAVALGYGREKAGKHGSRVGGNVYPFLGLTSGFLAYAGGAVDLATTNQKTELACTQDHHLMEGRDLVREMGYDAYKKDPASARHHEHVPVVSAYAPHPPGAHKWAMVIDLSKCSGCSACVISCQAENNLPVVGKEEVHRKREMHWMRIDRYYTGNESEPGVVHQPLMCQQCDNAPCENVCPVIATVHNSEGLNTQVYNRCVGTRYCANNCPYKTRRFNWFEYDRSDPVENLALNPDVTVRSRGVMEKCSFCIQRIQSAKATAKNEGREIKDGEFKTACQQSCPGMAIMFGDLQDPASEVAKAAKDPKRYLVLGELGIAPGVSYLTKIRNAQSPDHGGHHGA
jgi:molybdopterin-containing oxidoreductase family iron-sulfur binding subunit